MWSRKGNDPAGFLAVILACLIGIPHSTLVIMTVHIRKIGNDVVSPTGFGLMALSAFYGAIQNDEDSFKVGRSHTRTNSLKLTKPSGLQVLDAAIQDIF